MNIYVHELRTGIRQTAVWSASLASVGAFMIIVSQSLMADLEPLMALLRNYPTAALRALGIEVQSLNTFNGFYSFMVVYPILCVSIWALSMGIGVISKEAARRTADFLFSKPVRRRSALVQKYAAALTQLALGAVVYFLITLLAARTCVPELDMRAFALFSGAFFLSAALCLSIGFLIGCAARRIKSPNSVAVGIGAALLALQMMDNLLEGRSMRLISPLSYLNPSYIAQHRAYELPYLAALVIIAAAAVAAGVRYYCRKDL